MESYGLPRIIRISPKLGDQWFKSTNILEAKSFSQELSQERCTHINYKGGS